MNIAEQIAARNLQAALEKLELLESFVTLGRDAATQVTWTQGQSLHGYEELREQISALVAQQLPELQRQVLAHARRNVELARESMRQELNKP